MLLSKIFVVALTLQGIFQQLIMLMDTMSFVVFSSRLKFSVWEHIISCLRHLGEGLGKYLFLIIKWMLNNIQSWKTA